MLIPYTTKEDYYHYYETRNYVNDVNRKYTQSFKPMMTTSINERVIATATVEVATPIRLVETVKNSAREESKIISQYSERLFMVREAKEYFIIYFE